MRIKPLISIFLLFIISCTNQERSSWKFDSFTKPAENPILKADSTFTFICPVQKKLVQWQKADVFNRASAATDRDKITDFKWFEHN